MNETPIDQNISPEIFVEDVAIIEETQRLGVIPLLYALKKAHTYSYRNIYFIFGGLWGVPIPFVTIGIDLFATNQSISLSSLYQCISTHPWQIIFIFHPVLFAIIFGAMGTITLEHKQRIANLLQRQTKRKKPGLCSIFLRGYYDKDKNYNYRRCCCWSKCSSKSTSRK